jgi:hypothetical protein
MNREQAEKHWQYTESIILLMLKLCHFLYVEAMIHGAKHAGKGE